MKRTAVLGVLIALLLPGFVFASGGPGEKPAATHPNAGKVIYGWTVPAQTIEITYYVGQDDPERIAQWWPKIKPWYKDNMNLVLNPIVYPTDQNERLSLMLASGDYPEVIINLSADQAQNWVKLGKARELTGLIDKYGANIKSQLGNTLKRYADAQGRIFVVPGLWGYLPIPDAGASIRWDIWKEIGSPKFETTDEYFEVLKAMVKAHPTNDKGEKTYALSDYDGGQSLWKPLGGAFGLKDEYKEDANHNLTHWMNLPEGLQMARYMNRYFREGLLDPDFAINKYEEWKVKYSASRIMGSIGDWWIVWNAGHEVWSQTMPNWNQEMRGVQVKIRAPGVDTVYFSPKDTTGYYRVVMTDKCKQPENVMTFWNWEITDLATKIRWWGPPGPEKEFGWELKDGKSIWKDNVVQGFRTGGLWGMIAAWGKTDVWDSLPQMVTGEHLMKNGDPRTGKWVVNWVDQCFNDIDPWKKVMMDNLQDTIYDNTYRQVTFPPEEPVTVANQQVSDLLKTGWATMVQSKSDAELEASFYDLRDKLNKAGLHDIEQFRTAEYKKKLATW